MDAILSPIFSIAPDGGPTNFTPACSHASAKEAFSLRKPYLKNKGEEGIQKREGGGEMSGKTVRIEKSRERRGFTVARTETEKTQ